MLTVSGMLKKCAQRSAAVPERSRRNRLDVPVQPVRPAVIPALPREKPAKTGHALYDQLMKSHDRVRSRRF